jgi:UDP-N-acetylmuramoylalanine--D-glutamate ligase
MIEGARVLVVGLRTTGLSTARMLAARGATVTVVEDAPGAPGYARRVDAVRAAGAQLVESPAPDDWAALVAESTMVVPSPGVRPVHPVYEAAAAAGTPVRGDIDLGVALATVPVVAVTGTNGKTTVTTLVASMLEESGIAALATGNIGSGVLDAIESDVDVLVVEVSSFQLHATTASFRPRVAVLLNIAHDHIDWHGSFEAYVDAKRRVFEHQGPDDVLVFNADDPVVGDLARSAPGRTVAFASEAAAGTAGVRDGELLAPDATALATIRELGPLGPQDLANAAAAAAASIQVGATPDGMRSALMKFPRLHHRVELVGKADGVSYVDDSKATNPHATLAALAGVDSAVLLAGGDAKGVDLAVLREAAGHVRSVVAIGATPELVEAAFAGAVPVARAASMHDAVRMAAARAEAGDTVLLSPACASFDWYDGYEQRGDDFRHEVETLTGADAERERKR